MEYFEKGRGTLRTKKERSPKPAATTSANIATTVSNTVFGKPCFAGIACGGTALDCVSATLADPDSGAYATDPLARVTRPEPVSRISRLKSARISAALW